MISIPQSLIESVFLPGLLASTRIIGLFLAAPFFALQTIPQRFRIGLALVVAFGLPIEVGALSTISMTSSSAGFFLLAASELIVGLAMGWLVRVGMIVFDVAAEIISIQTGLSFASQYNPDQALPSGVVGSLFGLIGLALLFVMNLHLVVIELLFESFRALPPGRWPAVLDIDAVLKVFANSFGIGLLLALPFIAINLVVMAAQGFMGRTSPQMNLFSIGFALTIPVGIFLIYVLLPVFPEALQRSQEGVYALLRQTFSIARGN
ncbi:MAG: type III secretion protein [Betaproteobacteria bacterium]|nr:type III secretion protein [Betaproteobacteria bacterium]